MPRAILIVLDSVGVGGAPDADAYGDQGANTIGHIASACANGDGDRAGLRSGLLVLPNLVRLGLGKVVRAASGEAAPGLVVERIQQQSAVLRYKGYRFLLKY